MTKFRDYKEDEDPTVVVRRKFLQKIEVDPPKCVTQDLVEQATDVLDSDVPQNVEWMRFKGKELNLALTERNLEKVDFRV